MLGLDISDKNTPVMTQPEDQIPLTIYARQSVMLSITTIHLIRCRYLVTWNIANSFGLLICTTFILTRFLVTRVYTCISYMCFWLHVFTHVCLTHVSGDICLHLVILHVFTHIYLTRVSGFTCLNMFILHVFLVTHV